jgi:DNA-binding NarL/FixJ family response regulator
VSRAAVQDSDRNIRTLIVDDEEDIRLLLRLLIDRAGPGLSIVGEAASGREALRQAESCDPVVVVLDELMPDMTGIEAATELKARRPSQRIILFSAHLDESVVARAEQAGVDACVQKSLINTVPDVIRSLAVPPPL